WHGAGFLSSGTWRYAVGLTGKGQRLDHDGHDIGRHDDFADVDVVELHQLQAIDRNHRAFDLELFVQNPAARPADIAIQPDGQRNRRRWQAPGGGCTLECFRQVWPEIAVARHFATVDVLGDTTREGDASGCITVELQVIG